MNLLKRIGFLFFFFPLFDVYAGVDSRSLDGSVTRQFDIWCSQHKKKCGKVLEQCKADPRRCQKIKAGVFDDMLRYEKQCLEYPGQCETIKQHLKTMKKWCKDNKKACKKKRKQRKQWQKACKKDPLICLQNHDLDNFPDERELKDPELDEE